MPTNFKQIGMAAGTFSVALGIGFVMQNGDALASRFGSDTEAPVDAPFVAEQVEQVSLTTEEGVSAEDMPEVSEIAADIEMPVPVMASAIVLPQSMQTELAEEPLLLQATLEPEIDESVVEDISAIASNCVPTIDGVAGAAAMIKVSVVAPCNTNTPFTTHHQGMMFTAVTDDDGRATFTVPALAEVAVIITAFENGDGAVLTKTVPDFASYDRAVLQWQGNSPVMLSAYEDGSNFGDDGHIYAGNPGNPNRVSEALGGFLVQLGDVTVENALMAEVYTFPSGMTDFESDVMLVAEAEITAANCGQEMTAQSIQVAPSGATSALDLIMTMPECDAVGDVLILQNMFEDLTLAAR